MKHLIGLAILTACFCNAQVKHFIYNTAKSSSVQKAATPEAPGVYLAKQFKTEHNGVTHFVYQQRFSGLEAYGAAWVVNVDADGNVLNAGGLLYNDPGSIALPGESDSFEAVRAAVKAVNPELAKRYTPLLSGKGSASGLRFAATSLAEDIDGELVLYPVRGVLRPAWLFQVTDEDGVHSYTTIIESGSNLLLHKLPTTYFFQSAKGLVFEKESPQPNPNPGTRLTAAPAYVNRTMQPLTGDPLASPAGWVSTNQTAGNNTVTGENLLGTRFLLTPTLTTSPALDFNFPLELGPGATAPLAYRDAINTNLFYWINVAHDKHYLSGFDEAAGNFQQSNFGKAGAGGDPMYAYTHFGSSSEQRSQFLNAFFTTRNRQDGAASMIAMFIGGSGRGGYFTDGALDAGVVVHEYTHGVSTRLAKNVYSTFQGAAMGEAWSDFFALEYTLPEAAPSDGTYYVGEYFDQTWGVGDFRTRPYSTKTDVNPLTFANLGRVIDFPEVHADGEIWMEALWEARANLIAQFGDKEGRRRIRLLVLDGMKLMPPQGSMVDARDAILLADRVDFKGASQSQLWAAFAKRGLGALAFTTGGDTVHIRSSFELPTSKAQVAFYDDSFTIGETIRVIATDLNNDKPTFLVQLTSSSGDVEDLILTKSGSVYSGTIGSSGNVLNKQNGTINVIPGDEIRVYYVDADNGAGAGQLISTAARTTPGYALTGLTPRFSFSNERNLQLSTDQTPITIPFEFPFFDKKYRSMNIHLNGLLSFGLPVAYNYGCTDANSLADYAAIAPLWNQLTYGPASSNQGVYVSYPTPKSMTVRWALETFTQFSSGQPVNFAVTLTDEGLIQFQYGDGNAEVANSLAVAGCGPAPTVGISPGRDAYSQRVASSAFRNLGFQYEPPFNTPSLPEVIIESPKASDKVKGVMTVSGIVYDTKAALSRVDILIDGINRGRATTGVTRTDFCTTNNVAGCPRVGFTANLDLAALGITAGMHTLAIRATNIRGGYQQFPENPLSFEVESGTSRLPYGKLESPAPGAEASGTVTISGYAFADDLRVTAVDTLIDGVTYGPTTYGLGRTDICNALPTPRPLNCPAPGFRYIFNSLTVTPPLPNGVHKIQIRVKDELGRYTFIPETPVTFTVKNDALEKPVGALTSPKPNDVLKGIIDITGYAYTATGRVTSIVLLVDGSGYVLLTPGQPSPDVCATLPNVAACPNIGFTGRFDTRIVPNGPHVLGVQILNDKGGYIIVPALASYGMNVNIQN